MMKVIINADDLGISNSVNEAIEDAINKGLITSSTIMANADGYEKAIKIARSYPYISFGVHLTLDEFYPITRNPLFQEYGIVDNDFRFVKGAIYKVKFDKKILSAIEEELDAQISKIKESGVAVSHLDSHHHIHTIPHLRDVIVRLMAKHNIHAVRGCHYTNMTRFLNGFRFLNKGLLYEIAYLMAKVSKSFKSRKWNEEMAKVAKVTDFFCPTKTYFYNRPYFNALDDNKILELECHPGHLKYNKETELLKNLTGIEKITYNDL